MSIFEMSEDLKWTGTGNFRRWHTKIENFLMGQGVLDIANGVDPEPDAWISPSTPPTSKDRRQQERAQKAHRDWRVREQKAFYTIRVNIDDETCRRYDDIKTSSALLEKIRENSTRQRACVCLYL